MTTRIIATIVSTCAVVMAWSLPGSVPDIADPGGDQFDVLLERSIDRPFEAEQGLRALLGEVDGDSRLERARRLLSTSPLLVPRGFSDSAVPGAFDIALRALLDSEAGEQGDTLRAGYAALAPETWHVEDGLRLLGDAIDSGAEPDVAAQLVFAAVDRVAPISRHRESLARLIERARAAGFDGFAAHLVDTAELRLADETGVVVPSLSWGILAATSDDPTVAAAARLAGLRRQLISSDERRRSEARGDLLTLADEDLPPRLARRANEELALDGVRHGDGAFALRSVRRLVDVASRDRGVAGGDAATIGLPALAALLTLALDVLPHDSDHDLFVRSAVSVADLLPRGMGTASLESALAMAGIEGADVGDIDARLERAASLVGSDVLRPRVVDAEHDASIRFFCPTGLPADRLLDDEGRAAGAAFLLAQRLLDRGDAASALTWFERAGSRAECGRPYPEVERDRWRGIVTCLIGLGRGDEARDRLREALGDGLADVTGSDPIVRLVALELEADEGASLSRWVDARAGDASAKVGWRLRWERLLAAGDEESADEWLAEARERWPGDEVLVAP